MIIIMEFCFGVAVLQSTQVTLQAFGVAVVGLGPVSESEMESF